MHSLEDKLFAGLMGFIITFFVIVILGLIVYLFNEDSQIEKDLKQKLVNNEITVEEYYELREVLEIK
jgi:energy-converting hydrogenase Eha subunit H